jgi:hypothetical protein
MKNFNERIMMKEQTPYLTIDSINTAREKFPQQRKLLRYKRVSDCLKFLMPIFFEKRRSATCSFV